MAWPSTSLDAKIERFMSFIQRSNPDECWEWQGFINTGGYGRYKWHDRKNWLAHRLMWKLTFGEFDLQLKICHHCDNRLCCNPDHLFLGTQQDNVQDMCRKGRAKGAIGRNNPNAKLDFDIADDIRQLYNGGMTQIELGKKYGVVHSAIGRIVRNEGWTGVSRANNKRSVKNG